VSISSTTPPNVYPATQWWMDSHLAKQPATSSQAFGQQLIAKQALQKLDDALMDSPQIHNLSAKAPNLFQTLLNAPGHIDPGQRFSHPTPPPARPSAGKKFWEKFVLVAPLWSFVGGVLLLANTVLPHQRILKAVPALAKRVKSADGLKSQISDIGRGIMSSGFVVRSINGISGGIVSSQPSMIVANALQFIVAPLMLTARRPDQKTFANTLDMVLGGLFTLGFANEIENKIGAQTPNHRIKPRTYDMTRLKSLFSQHPESPRGLPWLGAFGTEIFKIVGFSLSDNLRLLGQAVIAPLGLWTQAVRDGALRPSNLAQKAKSGSRTSGTIVQALMVDPLKGSVKQTRHDVSRFVRYLTDPRVQGKQPTRAPWTRALRAHRQVKIENAQETKASAQSNLSKLPRWLTEPTATKGRVASLLWYLGGIPILFLTRRNPKIGENPLLVGFKVAGQVLANLQLFTLALARTDLSGKAPLLGVPLSIIGNSLGKNDVFLGLGYAGEAANNLFFSDMAVNGLDKSAEAAKAINALR
jgi:hypothetical protein